MPELLTHSSKKLDQSQNEEWLNKIMYLDPEYNPKVCIGASEGCRKSCLTNSGQMAMDNAINARYLRTQMYFDEPELFIMQLRGEIAKALIQARKKGKKLAVRLNGTSDMDWYDIYEAFPMVQFYEYTKRMDLIKKNSHLPNVDYTFSRHEKHSLRNIEKVLSQGINVTVVYDGEVPSEWEGHIVIDGDKHDRRFEDEKGRIVGLKLKGRNHAKAWARKTGFAVKV